VLGSLEWLLEGNQPAIRYKALTELLDRPQSDPEVREAFSSIPTQGWAADILGRQGQSGAWGSEEELYAPKYTATNWQWIILADLGLTRRDPRMKRTCNLMIERYARLDGGFGWKAGHFCSTGNSARTLIMCGYEDDPKVGSALDWLVRSQKEDGGWHCFKSEIGTLDCWEALSAFAALPRQKWTSSIKRTVERGVEFYLGHGLIHEGAETYEPWLRLHYPVHYYYDLLVGLDLVTRLGYSEDLRLRAAVDMLKRKRLPDGRWAVDAIHPDVEPGGYRPDAWPPGTRVEPFSLEKAGEPSKMITLIAMRALKRVEGGLPPQD